MFAQHPQPTRGVALHHGRLVVDLRVSIALAVFEHAVDGPQHLVGGGDRGAAVAAADLQVAVIAVELTVLGSGGGQGTLDEDAAQVRVAAAGASGAAFTGTFVVAGTQAGPGGALIGGGKHAHVGPEFDENGAGGGVVDARHGGQQVDEVLVLAQAVFDELVEPPDAVVQLLPGGEVFLEQEAGAVGQLGIQCVAQRVAMPLDMGGQRMDDLLWRAAEDEPLNDPLAIDSEQVGEDAADAQAGAVQGLMDAIAHARPFAHQLATLVGHLAQFAELRRRHEAGSAETELADAGLTTSHS